MSHFCNLEGINDYYCFFLGTKVSTVIFSKDQYRPLLFQKSFASIIFLHNLLKFLF